MIRITPKPGAPIRDPVTLERLPAEGILVDRVSAYWRRREADGGITTDEPHPAKPTEPAPKASTSRTTPAQTPKE